MHTGGTGSLDTEDAARWRRLASLDPSIPQRVVRALYVAILEREPDAEGLAHHARRLAAGLPLERLMAELALARDLEPSAAAAAVAAAATYESPPDADWSHTRELQAAQQRTLRALTRRLALLEDRLLAAEQGGEGRDPGQR
jgi:hypothetical protein